jgi:hypothetical protein
VLPKNYDLINQSLYEGLEYFTYLKVLGLIDYHYINNISSYDCYIKTEAHAYQLQLASQLYEIKQDIVQSKLTKYAIGYNSDIISQSSYGNRTMEPPTPLDYNGFSQRRIAIAGRPSASTRIPYPLERVDRENLKRQLPSEDSDINEYRSKKFAYASDHSYDASSSSEESFSECHFPEFNTNNSFVLTNGDFSNCDGPECNNSQYIVPESEEFISCQCPECIIYQHRVSAERPNFKRLLTTEDVEIQYNPRGVNKISYQPGYPSTPSKGSLSDSENTEGSARKIRRLSRNN